VPNRLAANQWRPLAKLEVEMAVAVGAGISGDLNLRMHDGRLLLLIKASSSGVLGSKAI
jgi:hypothetical protein